MKNTHLIFSIFCSMLALASGCSDDTETASNAGQSGSGGTAGSGAAGTGGNAGTSGAAGTSGTAGSGGTAGTGGTGGTVEPGVYAATDMIDGKTLAEQSVSWWQWALAVPKSTNPIEGADCSVDQSGNIWFLAGNATGLPTTRECSVAEGKTLFFPLINTFCAVCPEANGCSGPKTETELAACAKTDANNLALTIDGTSFDITEEYHVTSSQFSITAPANTSDQEFACIGPIAANTCGVPEGNRFAVSDGYWVAVKPLSKGPHTLHFTGTYSTPPPPFTEDNTFTITVQ